MRRKVRLRRRGPAPLIPALRTLRGDVPVIMISGGSMRPLRAGDARNLDCLRIAAEMGAAQTLAKPFNTRELTTLVAEVLADPNPGTRTEGLPRGPFVAKMPQQATIRHPNRCH